MMRTARNALRRFIENGDELCVTTQILAEFWNVCTRPADVNGLGNSRPRHIPGASAAVR